jgi:hypothetical protein
MSMRSILLCLIAWVVWSPGLSHAAPPLVEQYLHSGELAKGEQALERALLAEPKNDQIRYGLGLLRIVRAVERLGQSLHEYGVISDHSRFIPFLRLPVPPNPMPNRISHPGFRRLLDDFRRDLERAEATLAPIADDAVSLTLNLAEVRLDLDGDGRPTDKLIDILLTYVGRNPEFLKTNPTFRVRFDRADVPWFRGYCHLLMGLTDFLLAFDGELLFDGIGHLLFTRPRTKNADLKSIDGQALMAVLQNLKIKEPVRLKRCREHLLKVCETSRETWKYAHLETDDEAEWLPNPKQAKSAIGIRVSKEMIDAWLGMIGESEKVLNGDVILPTFIREDGGKGFHLRTFFDDPPEAINLMEWFEKVPEKYWQAGKPVDQEAWRRAERAFGGEFFGFSLWFN